MDFRKRIIQELRLSELQAETLLNDYVITCEKLAKEYHTEQLNIGGVSSSAFKDELIRKTENMIWFARENYNKEYYEGVLNAMRNLQVHIKKIYKKHYC